MRAALVDKMIILSLIIACIQTQNENSDIELEFDQTNIKSLKLTIRWRFKSNTNRKGTKYVLFYEVGKVNVFNNYAIEYSAPELLDDEEVVKASKMRRENFKNRAEFNFVSSYNCSLYCLNSTNVLIKNPFECNIFSYDPSVRKCVLYEYDYYNKYVPKKNHPRRYDEYEIYDYFIDECDMDEFFIEFAGYSRMCRRIMQYREEHSVIIRPFVDFRFSISLRDSENKWTPFLRKDFQYSPSVTIDIVGELKFGQNIKLICQTDLSKEVVESISWRNGASNSDTLNLIHFSPFNLHQTYYCEIRIGSKQMIQKAFKFSLKDFEDNLKPELKLNYYVNKHDLTVNLNWTIQPPENTKFRTEKFVLLYSEDGQDYKFPKKYYPFQYSKWQSANFPFNKDNKFFNATNEEECAKLCIQESFCNHFVFKYQIEPYWSDRFQSNCRLSSKTTEGFFPCLRFASCQNLKPAEIIVSNNSMTLSILPNVTYKFKLQMRDKYLNWTNSFETESIFVPLSITTEKIGPEIISNNSTFSLKCAINISNVNKIVWTKNDDEIASSNKLYAQSESRENQFKYSFLNFKINNEKNFTQFNGIYKCKIIQDSDIKSFVSFYSEPVTVNFRLNDSLNFKKLTSNFTLPTLPGHYLSLGCHAYGSSAQRLDWLVNGDLIKNKENSNYFNDMLVIQSETNQNINLINQTLILKLSNNKPKMKYECLLNGNESIRSHFVEIKNFKPQIDFRIEKSELNKLKLSLNIVPKRVENQFEYLNFKPLKLSILYSENSTFNGAQVIYIAPGTLSRTTTSSINKSKRENLIGNLLKPEHLIQSCKLACFQFPLCQSYEYLMYDDSCNFYSTSKIETHYQETINKLKEQNPGSNLNLLKMNNDVSKTIEEQIYNFTFLMDKKSYSFCENKTVNSFNEESYCRDEIADFQETYTMENLTPLTSYQFRIDVTNVFGISEPYFSEIVNVPFKLNKILLHEISDHNKLLKLECSTDLLTTDKLKFRWFRERNLIESQDKNFSQNDIIDHSVFKSELIFHGEINQFSGHYTCQLVYESSETKLLTNTTYLFLPKIQPSFSNFEQVHLIKNEGDILNENCSANGWPLPNLKWFYNNKSLDDIKQNSEDFPHYSTHHRNITVMSYLYGFNLKKEYQGVYICMLNGVTPIKNVTLTIGTDDENKEISDKESKIQPNKAEKNNTNLLINFVIGVLVVLAIGIIGGSFYFWKKKKSDINALMSYNRIEEELMTGVDNVNLTDDTQ